MKSKEENKEQELELSLTVDEVNKLLEGLSSFPLNKVFSLLRKTQKQAADQR